MFLRSLIRAIHASPHASLRPSRRWRVWRRFIACCVALAVLIQAQSVALAQASKGLPVIRDTEIEALLKDYVRPLMRAAGVGGSSGLDVVVVNDRSFNAFVADGRRIFITIGALLDSTSPNQVIGVLAHETGHIAGGHLARIRNQLQNAQTAMIIGLILGLGAVAAGAASGARGSDLGGAVGGIAMGSMGLGQRTLLAYQRTEEQAADRAAITYLNATKQSARGMLETFRRFADQMLTSSRFIDPYVQSHPMPMERIQNLTALVEASPHRNAPDSAAFKTRHEMMRAKISGFLERGDQVLRRYPASDTSAAARYAHAIAAYRTGSVEGAVRGLDQLIKEQPANPYLYEMKGQALLERGRPRDALMPYRKAAKMLPNSGLIRLGLGHALVAAEDPSLLDEGIRELERSVLQEKDASMGYRLLGIAYGRKKDEARASLATAQAYFIEGNYPLARQIAKRAQDLLPHGSPGWIRADDIVNFKAPRRDEE